MRKGMHELRLGQPSARRLQEVALTDVLGVHLVPRAPAERELVVHHALDANLPKMRYTLLTFSLKLQCHLTLKFRFTACSVQCLSTSAIQLSPQLANFSLSSQLFIDLLLKLFFSSHRCLLNHFRLPIALPVMEAVHERRPHQPLARGAQKALLARVLVIHLLPRGPAHGEFLVHHALHADLPEVRDARLALCLELLIRKTLEFLLARIARQDVLTHIVELFLESHHLSLCSLASSLFLLEELCLRLCHLCRRSSRHSGIPVALPMRKGMHELRLGQPSARRLQEVALTDVLGVHLMPRAPAERQLVVHHALDANLPKMRNTSFTLRLKHCFHRALHVGFFSISTDERRASFLELKFDSRQFLFDAVPLALLLLHELSMTHRCLVGHRRLPVVLPVMERMH